MKIMGSGDNGGSENSLSKFGTEPAVRDSNEIKPQASPDGESGILKKDGSYNYNLFMKKFGINSMEVEMWVSATKGMPFAALTINRLHLLINGALPSSDDHGSKVGFSE